MIVIFPELDDYLNQNEAQVNLKLNRALFAPLSKNQSAYEFQEQEKQNMFTGSLKQGILYFLPVNIFEP